MKYGIKMQTAVRRSTTKKANRFNSNKRTYTVEEANMVTGRSNHVRLRFK